MASPQNYVTVTRRQPDVEDYIDMLRRYRSWVIGPTFAGLVIAVVVAFCWPDTYESRAVMRIIPPTVPSTLVEGVSMNSMATRLDQMTVQILGRTSLMSIIQEPSLNLYQKERAHVTLDEVAEKMRVKDVKIKMYEAPGGNGAHGAQAFEIRFRYTDRFKAQQVVRKITTLFEGYNFELQRNQATTTANFLTDELKTAQTRMNTAQDALAQFAAQHPGELPQDTGTNTAQVNSKEQELHGIEDTVGRLGEQKSSLEIQLQNLNLMEASAAANVEQTQNIPGGVTLNNERILNLDKTINDANQRLENLRTQFRDGYPDVETQKKIVKSLEDKRAELEKSGAGTPITTAPQTRTVQNQAALTRMQELEVSKRTVNGNIANLNVDMDRLQKRYQRVQAELQGLQAKVAASPAVYQRYNDLLSELALAKEGYDAKSKMRDQSDTARSLEEHQAGERLELLESADLPDTPAEPNRWAIVGLGTFIGLLAGFGMAGAKELKNTSLKNLKDVRAYTNLPVLSSVPLLENALLVRRKRRLAWLAWSTAIVVGGILMSGAAYYWVSGKQGPS